MKKTSKKSSPRKPKAAGKRPVRKTGKRSKKSPKKSVRQRVTSSVKKTGAKARDMLDQQLATLSPNLKNKLDEVKSQLPLGDLRTLGLNVLERARGLSEKLRQQGGRGKTKKS